MSFSKNNYKQLAFPHRCVGIVLMLCWSCFEVIFAVGFICFLLFFVFVWLDAVVWSCLELFWSCFGIVLELCWSCCLLFVFVFELFCNCVLLFLLFSQTVDKTTTNNKEHQQTTNSHYKTVIKHQKNTTRFAKQQKTTTIQFWFA